jgi:hypothetical protein
MARKTDTFFSVAPGTLGALFRERGFFTGVDGGFDLTKSHRAGRAVAIAAVRKGRVSVLHDPTAYAHDLYTHAHSNQWTREDTKQRSIEHAFLKTVYSLRDTRGTRRSKALLWEARTKTRRRRCFRPYAWRGKGTV